jgi:hypothetical protein
MKDMMKPGMHACGHVRAEGTRDRRRRSEARCDTHERRGEPRGNVDGSTVEVRRMEWRQMKMRGVVHFWEEFGDRECRTHSAVGNATSNAHQLPGR